jgi:NTE family protein
VTTAFVLAGGASLGSIQVGMLRALLEAGVQPDLLVGTSVGALNASVIAGAPSLEGADELAEIWRSIKRSDVFPATPWHGALALAGRRSSLIRPDALRRLLESHVRFERLEQAAVPLYVVAVEVQRGEEIVLSSGPAVDAVLASAAIPGVFPPVHFGEHVLMDGGVANNTPISAAADLGADEIYVLPTGHACALAHPPASALGMALQALSIMMSQRVAVDAERCASSARLHVVPPLCPLDVSPADFSRSAELIARGYESTQAWLGDPERSNQLATTLLRPHSHM